jgi:hypothetical protein
MAMLGGPLGLPGLARAQARAVYVAAIADYSGHGSGRALVEQIEAALQTEGVLVRNATSLTAIAQQAGVSLDRTPSDEAAARLAFQVPLAGVLILRPSRHHPIAVILIDGQGRHLLATELRVPNAPNDVTMLAGQVSSAIGTPAATEPIPAPTPAPQPRTLAPAMIPTFRAALAPALATRTYSLPGLFTYQNDSPYGAFFASAEAFPFDEPGIHGLGVLADFQYGIAAAQIGSAPSFQQTDLRVDFDFAYRFIPLEGPYGPAVQALMGIGHRSFDAPASSGIPNDDRTYFALGVGLAQPILPGLLRLELGFSWMPVANATSPVALQQTYSTSTGTGIEWSAAIAGVPIGPIEFALRVDQQRFYDSYPASEGQPAASGTDVFTTYLLAVQYSLR